MHLFCNRLRIGRSRTSKVVDFGTNQKGVCDFLLVVNITLGFLSVNSPELFFGLVLGLLMIEKQKN